mmetsp:Transcript_13865/g.38326  ORF Transcript_13865/g.38326 Transcript_13865/m.38326 type:complete len:473 (-) Transcript_13865:149-1567(-)
MQQGKVFARRSGDKQVERWNGCFTSVDIAREVLRQLDNVGIQDAVKVAGQIRLFEGFLFATEFVSIMQRLRHLESCHLFLHNGHGQGRGIRSRTGRAQSERVVRVAAQIVIVVVPITQRPLQQLSNGLHLFAHQVINDVVRRFHTARIQVFLFLANGRERFLPKQWRIHGFEGFGHGFLLVVVARPGGRRGAAPLASAALLGGGWFVLENVVVVVGFLHDDPGVVFLAFVVDRIQQGFIVVVVVVVGFKIGIIIIHLVRFGVSFLGSRVFRFGSSSFPTARSWGILVVLTAAAAAATVIQTIGLDDRPSPPASRGGQRWLGFVLLVIVVLVVVIVAGPQDECVVLFFFFRGSCSRSFGGFLLLFRRFGCNFFVFQVVPQQNQVVGVQLLSNFVGFQIFPVAIVVFHAVKLRRGMKRRQDARIKDIVGKPFREARAHLPLGLGLWSSSSSSSSTSSSRRLSAFGTAGHGDENQ